MNILDFWIITILFILMKFWFIVKVIQVFNFPEFWEYQL